ncbi:GPGG-motif small membrane protein [Solicola gregarius]|uniref:GPGG-motif small membrane protein n=1 Tax=Solicola gregarius TaxID=2908642 RepID=A0AA46TLI4_9ACTN|nr:GPGG-motif small membrane protein [Solicola gregarius]UYM06638.1 GPGG-motif small membrane protein [Solicola gregarius]
MLGTIFWIAGVVLVLAGTVTLARGETLYGIVLIAAGVLFGPVAMALYV